MEAFKRNLASAAGPGAYSRADYIRVGSYSYGGYVGDRERIGNHKKKGPRSK